MSDLSPYELQRLENIKRNNAALAALAWSRRRGMALAAAREARLAASEARLRSHVGVQWQRRRLQGTLATWRLAALACAHEEQTRVISEASRPKEAVKAELAAAT